MQRRTGRRGARRGPFLRAAGIGLVVALATAGCGLGAGLGIDAGPTASSAPAPTSAAATTSAPPEATPVAALTFVEPSFGLTVTVGRVETAVSLPFTEFTDDCPVDWRTLQWVAVTVHSDAVGEGLAGHLTVHPTAATPADADVGVFFSPSPDSGRYCAHYPPLPTTDTFWSHGGGSTVTGYVVLDRAVSPATPQGRPEVFPTLQFELSDLRLLTDPAHGRSLQVGDVTAGSRCADDAQAVCAAL